MTILCALPLPYTAPQKAAQQQSRAPAAPARWRNACGRSSSTRPYRARRVVPSGAAVAPHNTQSRPDGVQCWRRREHAKQGPCASCSPWPIRMGGIAGGRWGVQLVFYVPMRRIPGPVVTGSVFYASRCRDLFQRVPHGRVRCTAMSSSHKGVRMSGTAAIHPM